MVNLLTTLVNQLGNKKQNPFNRRRNKLPKSLEKAGKTKTKAKRVPISKTSKLIKNGRYFICKKKKYIARKCLKYRPASRPTEVNYITANEPVSDNKNRKAAPAMRRKNNNPRCGFKISRCINNSVCVFCRTHKPESCAPLSTRPSTISRVIYLAVGSLPSSDQGDRAT
jgi:hypothetical protein